MNKLMKRGFSLIAIMISVSQLTKYVMIDKTEIGLPLIFTFVVIAGIYINIFQNEE